MLGRSPVGQVAAGTARPARRCIPGWRRRFEQECLPDLADRSRRPRISPTRLLAEVER
ncbi:leucine zipper domain-containing protein [Streptomyces sp. NBC_01304]|nr:leucine zipper domain-containing protein [Streptomyces sp. NBC_01304]